MAAVGIAAAAGAGGARPAPTQQGALALIAQAPLGRGADRDLGGSAVLAPASTGFRPLLLGIVAAGLLIFAAHSFMEGRYRRP
jgi:hypothetical protein